MCKITSVISRASREKSSFSSAQAVNTQKRATANNSDSVSSGSLSSIQTTPWHRATTWGTINPRLINYKIFQKHLKESRTKSCDQLWQSHPIIVTSIFKICGPKRSALRKRLGLPAAHTASRAPYHCKDPSQSSQHFAFPLEYNWSRLNKKIFRSTWCCWTKESGWKPKSSWCAAAVESPTKENAETQSYHQRFLIRMNCSDKNKNCQSQRLSRPHAFRRAMQQTHLL